MQRPVMDITYLDEGAPGGPAIRPRGIGRIWHGACAIVKVIWRTIRRIGRVLMYDPLSRTPLARFRNDDGSPLGRLVRGIAYRMAFIPVFAALAACAFVYSGTHPAADTSDLDPSSVGIYYEAVSFKADDNVRLDAWLVPAIEASKVLDQKEKILREKRPAAILLHNYGDRRQQMMPLIRPLHDAGFVVLVPAMRGSSSSESAGQTFGLHEALDVKGAVDLLRKRNFVDPDRITLVGVGSGANAAMLAANNDPRILAMVLQDPASNINQVINQHIAPKHEYLRWIRPLCKWTFEIAYEVDAEELNASRHAAMMKKRSVLMFSDSAESETFSSTDKLEQIKHFLTLKSEEKLLRIPASGPKRVADVRK